MASDRSLKLNPRRFLLGSLAVWVFIVVYEFLLHGVVLKDMYLEIPDLLRADEEFNSFFAWVIVGEGLLAFFFSYIFTRGYRKTGVMEGLRYGLLVGIGFGVSSSLIQYAVHPFPGTLILAWCVGYTVELALAGVIIAAIYKPFE